MLPVYRQIRMSSPVFKPITKSSRKTGQEIETFSALLKAEDDDWEVLMEALNLSSLSRVKKSFQSRSLPTYLGAGCLPLSNSRLNFPTDSGPSLPPESIRSS